MYKTPSIKFMHLYLSIQNLYIYIKPLASFLYLYLTAVRKPHQAGEWMTEFPNFKAFLKVILYKHKVL